MSTTPPTDPSLRRGVKTSEFMLTAVTVFATLLSSLLVMLDAIAPNVPPKYAAILGAASIASSALLVGLYSLGRNLAKASASSSVPAYLEALRQSDQSYPAVSISAVEPTVADSGSIPTVLPEGEDELGIDPDADPAALS